MSSTVFDLFDLFGSFGFGVMSAKSFLGAGLHRTSQCCNFPVEKTDPTRQLKQSAVEILAT